MIPRQMFERVGGFREEFKGAQAFEDLWMLLLLRELGKFVYVPKSSLLYRGWLKMDPPISTRSACASSLLW